MTATVRRLSIAYLVWCLAHDDEHQASSPAGPAKRFYSYIVIFLFVIPLAGGVPRAHGRIGPGNSTRGDHPRKTRNRPARNEHPRPLCLRPSPQSDTPVQGCLTRSGLDSHWQNAWRVGGSSANCTRRRQRSCKLQCLYLLFTAHQR